MGIYFSFYNKPNQALPRCNTLPKSEKYFFLVWKNLKIYLNNKQ
ncbi:hypothetical protein M23134_06651 [Microscilla marina ATCC 23134]|uniref:Uncharacterized protein n=1 Tax=Microscilla marina ATCC 23134 TaxID=313606 RepID=A1ZW29_MICM2|nr:hypothetical protein M23134_06651 [Microscilla marina ATCC 23134]